MIDDGTMQLIALPITATTCEKSWNLGGCAESHSRVLVVAWNMFRDNYDFNQFPGHTFSFGSLCVFSLAASNPTQIPSKPTTGVTSSLESWGEFEGDLLGIGGGKRKKRKVIQNEKVWPGKLFEIIPNVVLCNDKHPEWFFERPPRFETRDIPPPHWFSQVAIVMARHRCRISITICQSTT